MASKNVTPRANTPTSQTAEAFVAFMATVLQRPVDGLTQDDAPDEPLVYVRTNGKVHDNYTARGVFPEFTKCTVQRSRGSLGVAWARVPLSVARQMLADAIQNEREKPAGTKGLTAWGWLRKNLGEELQRLEARRG